MADLRDNVDLQIQTPQQAEAEDCLLGLLNETIDVDVDVDLDVNVDVNVDVKVKRGNSTVAAPKKAVSAAPANSPVNTTIKYAPVVEPVKGNFNLYAVALKWINNKGPSLSSVSSTGKSAANIYKNLSSGYVTFNVMPKVVAVNYTHTAKNIPAAEAEAKRKINAPATKRNIYAMVNNHAKSVSNAGGDTAHLLGTLTRDWLHEIGHLRPFRLGHSGKYDEKGKLKAYDDGTSFMSRFSSNVLTASQLYFLGWLPEKKVAQFDATDPATDFNIQNLYAPNTGECLKAVLMPRTGRPLFLSMPQVNGKAMFALHLATGGGSQRVKVFSTKAEYDGLSFEKVAVNGGCSTVRISPITTKK